MKQKTSCSPSVEALESEAALLVFFDLHEFGDGAFHFINGRFF
jgi:hypothetical protein